MPSAPKRLGALLCQSPRSFGKEASIWTLALAAEVSFEQGLTQERVSGETLRNWPNVSVPTLAVSMNRILHLPDNLSDHALGYAIAGDAGGAAYVTGPTASSDFPTTPGAFDPSHNGVEDAFVAKLLLIRLDLYLPLVLRNP